MKKWVVISLLLLLLFLGLEVGEWLFLSTSWLITSFFQSWFGELLVRESFKIVVLALGMFVGYVFVGDLKTKEESSLAPIPTVFILWLFLLLADTAGGDAYGLDFGEAWAQARQHTGGYFFLSCLSILAGCILYAFFPSPKEKKEATSGTGEMAMDEAREA